MPGAFRLVETLRRADRSIRLGIVDGAPDRQLAGLEILEIEPTMRIAGHDCPDAHGTEICSILFDAEFGLVPEATGIVLPIFFNAASAPDGPPRASQLDIARALTMAVERGAEIVNISAGQMSATVEAGRHLEDALALCHRKGILVVAAAGNDGCACLHVPAAVPTVLAVGAMDDDGQPLAASNYGAGYAQNGILAPGVDIPVKTLGGVRATRTGTSFATAVVSGIAARLLATARQDSPAFRPDDIRTLLIETADPCQQLLDGDCARILAGRLNLAAALRKLRPAAETQTSAFHPPRLHVPPSPTRRGLMTNQGMLQSAFDPSAHLAPALATMSSAAGVEQLACGCSGGKAGCACGGKGSCSCKGHDHENENVEARQSGTPVAAFAVPDAADAAVTQQGCGCGEKKEPQKVYAIGSLWFDFGSEARYDAIVQQIGDPIAANTPTTLLTFLANNLPFATGITFILMQDQIPIYAVAPSGPFAADIYREMINAMQTSMDPTGDLQRVAVPGLMYGSTRLMNGMVLPVLYADIRGMVKWQAPKLAAAAKEAVGDDAVDEGSIFNFLVRVYDELRNLGINPEERAINFAATNAYQAASAFADGVRRNLELYRFAVKKSPICRPDSDCWDVQMVMFDPENDRRAGRFYRFTVDVSEVLPVTVGPMRSWSAPLGSI